MATSAAPVVEPGVLIAGGAEPLLEAGDRLSRAEFERRYERLPHLKKAELIEGTVYMPSPVRVYRHAKPHGQLGTWLGLYAAETAGVECADNSTVRLDLDNEAQPDLVLLKLPAKGGQARISADDYIEGAPELVVEIVGSSHAYDLHQKKGAYRRNGVREYCAWITGEQRPTWWELREGDYQEAGPGGRRAAQERRFPGSVPHAVALLEAMRAVVLWLCSSDCQSRCNKPRGSLGMRHGAALPTAPSLYRVPPACRFDGGGWRGFCPAGLAAGRGLSRRPFGCGASATVDVSRSIPKTPASSFSAMAAAGSPTASFPTISAAEARLMSSAGSTPRNKKNNSGF